MQTTTMGLVLRATKTGEADRVLTILTPQHGLVTAIAKGALRIKNKLFSATGLLCYSEFTLFEGKTMYVVDEAEVRSVFWGVHNDVENMALALYLAELTMLFSPVGSEAESLLKLLLNSLYLLSEHKRPPRLVKAVFELRALSQVGFMPNLVACADCVKYEGGSFWFDTQTGLLYCAECAENRGKASNLSPSALAAMRHIVYSDDSKLFAFSLGDEALAQLSAVAGEYTLLCVEKPLKTLEFLNTMLQP
jgi:DNA repair protein RecO (recombination protein O)